MAVTLLMSRNWVYIFFAILLPLAAGATTLNVPSAEYPTIQAGVDSAQVGDTVLVTEGVYTGDGNRDIELRGKDIVLRSEYGPEVTIVDCEGYAGVPHRAFFIHSGETVACRIEGFTIRNGYQYYASDGGGAVCLERAAATFSNCIFENNQGWLGGTVRLFVSSTIFIGCEFRQSLGKVGGVIYGQHESTQVFTGCRFDGNQADSGGVMYFNHLIAVSIDSCSFAGNSALYGGVFSASDDVSYDLSHSTFIQNSATYGGVFNASNTVSVDLDWGILNDNNASFGGVIFTGEGGRASFTQCDLLKNAADSAGSVVYGDSGNSGTVLQNCIVAFATGQPPIEGDNVTLFCSDIFRCEAGGWVGSIEDQKDLNGNLAEDPMFCDGAAGEYNLWYLSSCLPENSSCGLIGALGVGCEGVNLPIATVVSYSGATLGNVVRTTTPEILWHYTDTAITTQTAYQIEVGTDDEWTYAELWSTGEVLTSDTSAVYGGAPLSDRRSYYLRLRVANPSSWGDWTESLFSVRLVHDDFEPSDWPMFRHDALHTGANSIARINPPLDLVWKREVAVDPLIEVSIADGRVLAVPVLSRDPSYAIGAVNCLEESNGSVVWYDSLLSIEFFSQPTVGHGYLYEQVGFGRYSGIVAYDLATGAADWSFLYYAQTDRERGPTLYKDILVFAGGTFGGIFAIDALSGEGIWFDPGAMITWWAASVYKDTVYTYIGGTLQARYIYEGDMVWYVSTIGEPCPDRTTGIGSTLSAWMGTAPVLDTNTNIAYLMWHRQFDAVDLTTREVLWRNCGIYAIPENIPCPVLYEGKLYALESYRLVCYDGITGEELWDCVGPQQFFYSPVAADGYILVSSDSTTYAVNIETRSIEWTLPHGGHTSVANDRVYIGGNDGHVYAYGAAPTSVDESGIAEALPTAFALSQNYPNPFNPMTTINFALPQRSHVELVVYNILGQRVVTLVDDDRPPGEYEAAWHGEDSHGRSVSTGVYFYRITAGEFVETKKMLLVK